MGLLLLAPDMQEAILFLPPTDGLRSPIGERTVRPICAVLDWCRQRKMWGDLVGTRDSGRAILSTDQLTDNRLDSLPTSADGVSRRGRS